MTAEDRAFILQVLTLIIPSVLAYFAYRRSNQNSALLESSKGHIEKLDIKVNGNLDKLVNKVDQAASAAAEAVHAAIVAADAAKQASANAEAAHRASLAALTAKGGLP